MIKLLLLSRGVEWDLPTLAWTAGVRQHMIAVAVVAVACRHPGPEVSRGLPQAGTARPRFAAAPVSGQNGTFRARLRIASRALNAHARDIRSRRR